MKAKKKHDRANQRSFLLSALERQITLDGGRQLLRHYGQSGSVEALTFAEVFARVRGLAGYLCAHGVERGAHVIFDVDTGLSNAVLCGWLACQMIGAVAQLWPSDMRYRFQKEAASQGDEACGGSPAVVFIGHIDRVPKWRENDTGAAARRLLICLSGTEGCMDADVVSYAQAVASPGVEKCALVAAEEEAALVCTQGTHQRARLVPLAYAHLEAQVDDLRGNFELSSECSVFVDLATVHTVCLELFAACIYSGAVFVSRDADVLVSEILESERPTHVFLLPSEMAILAESCLPENASAWRRFCLRMGKVRAARRLGGWGGNLLRVACVRPIEAEILHGARMVISYGNHFDAKAAELFGILGTRVFNAYTVSEFGFVHLKEQFKAGGYLRSVEACVRGGMLAVRSRRVGMPWLSMDDLVFEDELRGIYAHRPLRVTLSDGAEVDTSPMREILRRDPIIDEVFIFGEGRPWLSALIYLNAARLFEWASAQKIDADKFSALTQDPRVYQHILGIVSACNLKRAARESVQKMAILPKTLQEDPRILSICGLTRPDDVERRYAAMIESFYRENF
ncbi:MAG: AMP-binding protein [Proteobacteria bacterium]|nr:AMP-binding protein [Pseudomonadota bacterium]